MTCAVPGNDTESPFYNIKGGEELARVLSVQCGAHSRILPRAPQCGQRGGCRIDDNAVVFINVHSQLEDPVRKRLAKQLPNCLRVVTMVGRACFASSDVNIGKSRRIPRGFGGNLCDSYDQFCPVASMEAMRTRIEVVGELLPSLISPGTITSYNFQVSTASFCV